MPVGAVVTCIHTKFCMPGLSGFRDIAAFQKWPNFPFGPWTIAHWGQKIEWAQKFMQIEVDERCILTKFGGCGL